MTISMVGGAVALLCFAAVDGLAEKTENGFSYWFNLVRWPQFCGYGLGLIFRRATEWLFRGMATRIS